MKLRSPSFPADATKTMPDLIACLIAARSKLLCWPPPTLMLMTTGAAPSAPDVFSCVT